MANTFLNCHFDYWNPSLISFFIVAVYNAERSNLFSEDDSDDGEGDAANKRRSNPEAKGASKRIKIGMSESKALSM